MKFRHACLALALAAMALAAPPSGDMQQDFPLGPDSKPQPGVPAGEVLKLSFEQSKIFPGAYRDYWVYVPAQYRPERPACVYVTSAS